MRPSPLLSLARELVKFGRARAIAGLVLSIAGMLAEGVGVLLLLPALGALAGGSASDGLPKTAALLALAIVARSAILMMRDRVLNALQFGFVESVRMRVVRSLAGADWQRVSQLDHARAVQALSAEIHQIGIAASALVSATVGSVMVVGLAVLATVLAPAAAVPAIAAGIVGGTLVRRTLGRAKPLGEAITARHFATTAEAIRFLAGLKTAAAQGCEALYVAQQHKASEQVLSERLAFAFIHSHARELTAWLAIGVASAAAAPYLIAGWNLATVAPVLLLLARMAGPAAAIQQAAQQLLHSIPAYRAVRLLEGELATPAAPRRALVGPAAAIAGISFDRVSFRHGGRTILRKLTLRIAPGAFVGIAGPSGIGKTTMLDLVAGLLEPSAGALLVDGVSLHGVGLRDHRRKLAYIGQEPYLFDGTLRQNLHWSTDADDRQILAALAMVDAAHLASGEHDLGRRLGERGLLLSAGERQRLALARALLRRPRILLLDEATNAIDLASERRLLAMLAALTPRPTLLLVAHRQESFHVCDRVIALDRPAARPFAELNIARTP